jgi:predicted nucleic acid-binding protein
MIFLVNDANILIDLLKIDLLDSFFQLDFDFHVTDIVYSEIQEENSDKLEICIESKLLTKQCFQFEDLVEIQKVRDYNPALSIADCSCLYLAKKLDAMLLTGDGALRRVAEKQEIPVHGILWVLDEIISCGLLAKVEVRNKLIQLIEQNQRLPLHECQKRIKAWKPRL